MMMKKSVVAGYERLAAWADLLDSINVYPVADGDTGRNLAVSLAPLRDYPRDGSASIERLLMSARGNSGNIAARFFSSFLESPTVESLADSIKKGASAAWSAVDVPKKGTMLTLFDDLAAFMDKCPDACSSADALIERLAASVRSTTDLLPKLKEAGVVDSGALGMFLFFEGFFLSLAGSEDRFVPVAERFGDSIKISPAFRETEEDGFCIDMVLRVTGKASDAARDLAAMGESVVVIPEKDFLKVHLHTGDPEGVRSKIRSLGTVVRWSSDDLGSQIRDFGTAKKTTAVHIVSDAAGSLTRDDAVRYGFTLLDSYIIAGDESAPETSCSPDHLYGLMKKGVRVSTSQASVFERHQHYERLVYEHGSSIYMCVGSVYTGNYSTVIEWKKDHDQENRLRVIDSGAASGRLGLSVLATIAYASGETDAEKVKMFAEKAVEECGELLFLERLHYLAAGGRMSRTGAFFGDLLSVKPVVSPFHDGARKLGVVRSTGDQVSYALDKMGAALKKESVPVIMLEYTDNRQWVEEYVRVRIAELFPAAVFILQPLSLTTGVHTGPGTWGVAYLPGHMNFLK